MAMRPRAKMLPWITLYYCMSILVLLKYYRLAALWELIKIIFSADWLLTSECNTICKTSSYQNCLQSQHLSLSTGCFSITSINYNDWTDSWEQDCIFVRWQVAFSLVLWRHTVIRCNSIFAKYLQYFGLKSWLGD